MLYDCPECGLPATVTPHGSFGGTDPNVEHVRVHCAGDHRFFGPADRLQVLLPIHDPRAV